jgi:hypothetical protein
MGVSGIRACCFAVLMALAILVGARINPAAGQIGKTSPGVCSVNNCNAFVNQPSGGCAGLSSPMCDLSMSGGNVTWCNSTVKGSCQWFNPTQNNPPCQGFCVVDINVGCSYVWQKCQNPK